MATAGVGTAWKGGAQSGSPASSAANGAASIKGGGQIAAEGSCMTKAPTEYPFGTNFPTQTIKNSTSS